MTPTMTRAKLKAQLEQRARAKAARLSPSGSPAVIVLHRDKDTRSARSITVIQALAANGLSLLKAKRTVEAAMRDGSAVVEVPAVECITALAREMRGTGFHIATHATDTVDVKMLRERLAMSQEQFALHFNVPLGTLVNWEQGRVKPDRAANNYLRVIANNPSVAAKAVEEAV
jgi:DNA-binding transcriptional regulator YiaG